MKELNEKDIYELEKIELPFLNKIVRKDEEDKDVTDEDNEIINEILAIELTEEEKNKAKKLELTEVKKK